MQIRTGGIAADDRRYGRAARFQPFPFSSAFTTART
jgi:hypothetical protein